MRCNAYQTECNNIIACTLYNKLSVSDSQYHLWGINEIKSFDTAQEVYNWIAKENSKLETIRQYVIVEDCTI